MSRVVPEELFRTAKYRPQYPEWLFEGNTETRLRSSSVIMGTAPSLVPAEVGRRRPNRPKFFAWERMTGRVGI